MKMSLVVSIAALLVAILAQGQASQEKKDRPETYPAAPTLGFNQTKGVSPIIDSDALVEEEDMEKKLPGNEFVHHKRAFHEAALMNEFLDGFKKSKECNGITFYMNTDKKPAFVAQVSVLGHDKHPDDQTWTWMLFWPGDPSPENKSGHGMGGLGSQSNAALTAKDICLTIWDDVDPNHFKEPGGKIE
jgi:hypothetical protein